MNKLIDAKVSPPPDGDEVWIFDEEYGVCIGDYYRGYWSANDDNHEPTEYYHVTHWQPLISPEPPGEKE